MDLTVVAWRLALVERAATVSPRHEPTTLQRRRGLGLLVGGSPDGFYPNRG
jgi:hypothetical protein